MRLVQCKIHHKKECVSYRDCLREHFDKVGGVGLHDSELLELVLFLSIPRAEVKSIAQILLDRFKSLSGIVHAEKKLLREISGINYQTIYSLKAILALQQRISQERIQKRDLRMCFEDIIIYSRSHMCLITIEEVRVLFLDHKMRLIQDEVHQRGTVNESALYVRELLKRALELNSSNLIVIHNHPSGDPDPSLEDIQMTYALIKAGKPLNISLYDHIIVAHDLHFSFNHKGLLKGI